MKIVYSLIVRNAFCCMQQMLLATAAWQTKWMTLHYHSQEYYYYFAEMSLYCGVRCCCHCCQDKFVNLLVQTKWTWTWTSLLYAVAAHFILNLIFFFWLLRICIFIRLWRRQARKRKSSKSFSRQNRRHLCTFLRCKLKKTMNGVVGSNKESLIKRSSFVI